MGKDKPLENLVFGLDIGTRSIVGMVGYKENNQFIVVAQCVREHETRAMMDGQIHDIDQVTKTIKEVKEELEQQLEQELSEVCIAAAGRVLKTVRVTSEYEFASETTVNEEHINSLNLMGVEKAYNTLREELREDKIDFYCVGYTVINYTLNGYSMMKLNGHKASRISTELIATFLPDEVINGLYAAVEAAGLKVATLTLEPIAAINVAIPEKFRLLNIAMVDVGAGTSDICITKDGGVMAYGMIPYAGDEITEYIAQKYLVEFKVAEDIKTSCLKKKKVTFKDVLGMTHHLTTQEVLLEVSEIINKITQCIADKIMELNGSKTVSAVFIVGGGGKIPGFVENIAQYLGLPKERVALRGEDVLGDVTFLQDNIKKDSLLVTPIGICLNYYDQSNNFIFVNVNGEHIKIYYNKNLTISDAAVQIGYPNNKLFPQRGKALEFTVNGIPRTIKGGIGEAANIKLNGETVGLSHNIENDDQIEIIESTAGKAAQCELKKLPEYHGSINIIVNGSKVFFPKMITVNNSTVSANYLIQDKDAIEISDYYTLKQVLEYMDLEFDGDILVNNELADMDEIIYENDTIQFIINTPGVNPVDNMPEEAMTQSLSNDAYEQGLQKEIKVQNLPEERVVHEPIKEEQKILIEPDINTEVTEKKASDLRIEADDIGTADFKKELTVPRTLDLKAESDEENKPIITKAPQTFSAPVMKEEVSPDIYITVNAKVVKLTGKNSYIFVDIFDFYPFDLSTMRGSELVVMLNGERAEFTSALKDKDNVEIYWKE